MKYLKFLLSGVFVALLVFSFSSCQKDLAVLRLSFDGFNCNSKIYMDGFAPKWDGSESVIVNGQQYSVSSPNIGSLASLSVASAAQYSAVFPADFFTDPSNMYSFDAPRFQEYKTDDNGHQLVMAPMGAYCADGSNLVFTPMGSLLAINIENQIERTMIIDSVVVKASSVSLCGSAIVNQLSSASRNYIITDQYSESNSCVSLVRLSSSGVAQSLHINLSEVAAPVFYVFVPGVGAGVDNRFTVYVYAHPSGGTMLYRYEMSQQNQNGGSIPSGYMANATFTMSVDNEHELHDLSEGLLPGRFAIGEDRYVCFSKGNLQYSISDGIWCFAENQYETLGENNSYSIRDNRTKIDLFGFGTSGYDDYFPNSINQGYSQSIYGTHYDWGIHNSIFNGGNQDNLWRTLTREEWLYLFSNNSYKSTTIVVNDNLSVKGFVIYPGSDISLLDSYSLSDWESLERMGGVFLPVTSCRLDRYYQAGVTYADKFFYWSSSFYSASNTAPYTAYCITNASTHPNNNPPYVDILLIPGCSGVYYSRANVSMGCAVRLCRDVD